MVWRKSTSRRKATKVSSVLEADLHLRKKRGGKSQRRGGKVTSAVKGTNGFRPVVKLTRMTPKLQTSFEAVLYETE